MTHQPETTSAEPDMTYAAIKKVLSDSGYHPFLRAGIKCAMPEIETLRAALTAMLCRFEGDAMGDSKSPDSAIIKQARAALEVAAP